MRSLIFHTYRLLWKRSRSKSNQIKPENRDGGGSKSHRSGRTCVSSFISVLPASFCSLFCTTSACGHWQWRPSALGVMGPRNYGINLSRWNCQVKYRLSVFGLLNYIRLCVCFSFFFCTNTKLPTFLLSLLMLRFFLFEVVAHQ